MGLKVRSAVQAAGLSWGNHSRRALVVSKPKRVSVRRLERALAEVIRLYAEPVRRGMAQS